MSLVSDRNLIGRIARVTGTAVTSRLRCIERDFTTLGKCFPNRREEIERRWFEFLKLVALELDKIKEDEQLYSQRRFEEVTKSLDRSTA